MSRPFKSQLPGLQNPGLSLSDLQLRTATIFSDRTVIGEGTFGKVYKAKIKNENDEGFKYYALKMIKMGIDKEGFPITAMREIKLLKRLQHKNIVNLQEIVTSSDNNQGERG